LSYTGVKKVKKLKTPAGPVELKMVAGWKRALRKARSKPVRKKTKKPTILDAWLAREGERSL